MQGWGQFLFEIYELNSALVSSELEHKLELKDFEMEEWNGIDHLII